MTPQEALYWCEQFTDNVVLADPQREKMVLAIQAMKQCKEALEKQIPKKPILKETKCFDGSTDDFVFICPVCNRTICREPEDDVIADYIKVEYPYCNCGQALDWSDTE